MKRFSWAPGLVALVTAIGLTASACQDVFLTEPATDERVVIDFAPLLLEGPATAPIQDLLAQTDAVRTRIVTQNDETLLADETIPLDLSTGTPEARLAISLEQESVAVRGEFRLLVGGEMIFAAVESFTLTRGEETVVTPNVDPEVASVQITPVEPVTVLGTQMAIEATAHYATGQTIDGATFTYESLDPSVLASSGGNVFEAVGEGTGTIRVTASAGAIELDTSNDSEDVDVQVTAVAVTLVADPSSLLLEVGETAGLEITALDADENVLSRNVAFSSEDPDVATVASTGGGSAEVTGASAGSTRVIATVGDLSVAVDVSVGFAGTGEISGVVRDLETGAPLPDATLELSGPLGIAAAAASTGPLAITVMVDDQGRFSITGLPPGTYELVVTAQDHRTNIAPSIVIGEGEGELVRVDFALPEDDVTQAVANLAGSVEDESGAPVENAVVQISGGQQTNGVFQGTTTGPDGTYTLTGVVLSDPSGDPIESFTVFASGNGFQTQSAADVPLENDRTLTNLDFILPPAGDTDVFFSDGFENGFSGWMAEGLWNSPTSSGIVNQAVPTYVSLAPNDNSGGALPSALEGSRYAWYGDPSEGNYINGQVSGDAEKSGGTSVSPHSGVLYSPPFTISSDASQASLTFTTWFEIESVNPNAAGYDRMRVQIRNVQTEEVTELGRLNPAVDPVSTGVDIPFTSGGINQAPIFRPFAFSLDEFIGQQVQVIFFFETVDGLYNGFRGWIVDDIEVTSEQAIGVPGYQAPSATPARDTEPPPRRPVAAPGSTGGG